MIPSVTAGTPSVITSGTNPAATPGIPSGSGAGDLMVIVDGVRASNNTVPNTPGTPSGWTAGDTFGATGASRAVRLSWFWRPWVSGLTAPSISLTAASGTVHYALMARLPGALLSGDPTDYLGAQGSPANNTTTMGPFAGGTTSKVGSAVLVAAVRENDVTDGSTVTPPSASGLSFTLLDSYGTASGEDAVFAVAAALVPNPATIGNLSFTVDHDQSQKSIGQQWAIAPAPDTGSFFPILANL